MHRGLICELVEQAYRAGMRDGGQHFADSHDKPSVEGWAERIPVDCYTVAAKNPGVARAMDRIRTEVA